MVAGFVSMKALSHISILSVLLLLLSCAAVSPQASEPESGDGTAAADSPEAPLDADTLFDILLGELAAQQGQAGVAAESLGRAAERTGDPRLAERAALAAMFAKQYEAARRAAQLWVDRRPDSPEAHETLASALLELGRGEEARSEFEHLLKMERARNNLDQSFLRIAAVLGRASNRDGAIELMRQLVSQNPDVAAGHFALAHLAVRAGDLDVAAAAVDRALALKPDWEDAALFKARILVSKKDNAQAQRYFETFLQSHPGANSIRLHYARFLVDQKQWEQAREQFKRVVAQAPNDADSIYAVALLALQTNRLEEAQTYLKRVLELRPHNDQARIYLGQALEEDKRYSEAAQWYGEVRSDELYVEARSRLAIVTAKQGDIEKARTLLHEVPTENDQQRVQLVLAEEQMLRDAKRYRDALTVLNEAIERMPTDKELLYARALVAERLDMLPLLESDLRAVLSRDPKNANALNALGYTLADRTDRLAEARTLLTQALEQKPDDPFVLDSVGWLHYREGNNAEAIRYLKRALTIRSDAEIAAHLGEVLWVTGDRTEAESVWTRALRDTPDNEALRAVIKKFKP
jgi:tetratricopeptide (TPR) repeat protein